MGALSSIPEKSWSLPQHCRRGRPAGPPPRLGYCISVSAKPSIPFELIFASWQLRRDLFLHRCSLALPGLAPASGRALRLDFTRGRRNFSLETSGGSSRKVGCLFLRFNQLERCRVELEVTGRGSRLASG